LYSRSTPQLTFLSLTTVIALILERLSSFWIKGLIRMWTCILEGRLAVCCNLINFLSEILNQLILLPWIEVFISTFHKFLHFILWKRRWFRDFFMTFFFHFINYWNKKKLLNNNLVWLVCNNISLFLSLILIRCDIFYYLLKEIKF
jgi:hypothetical protein